jgi:glutamate-1-semialdehyde 2,1-aminomutase
MSVELTIAAVGLAAAGVSPLAWRRWLLSRAKHPSLTGHARWARRIARWMPGTVRSEAQLVADDGAPPDVQQRRVAGLQRLSLVYRERFAKTLAATERVRDALPDLAFTGRYRVPFPYTDAVKPYLSVGAFAAAAEGVTLTDLDGNRFLDLTGSYGVNVFGVDFYKDCLRDGLERAQALGPVLGSYHPVVETNVRRLQALSGLDTVSFHMSGTEAVMQAVRLARYHTRRSHIVRFCGAYHGWWEDVQPGPGNPMPPRETYTLREMSARSLRVLASRRDIACVLVNPLQALHPNQAAPGDTSLLDGSRRAGFDRDAYAQWLQALRQVCTERGIVLIFDEVFMGFRLAPGGAQQYFGVRADMVTYGKTLGGGLPVGVVCGRADLMKRFRRERPADICFARGTFNAHPQVMTSMGAFLDRLETPEVQALYRDLDETWDEHRERFNRCMQAEGFPVRAANLGTVWTLWYEQTSRYHWLYQFYLREQGIALSWVGTGRLVFGLHWQRADVDAVIARCVTAARQMAQDGWWWTDGRDTPRRIRRGLLLRALLSRHG